MTHSKYTGHRNGFRDRQGGKRLHGGCFFSTSGEVEPTDVAVGDVVTKGQKLATLDSVEADQQLAVAESNLAVAEENLGNAGSAAQGSQGASESTTSLQAKVDSAELAQDAVDATTLTAPGDGTVTAINGAEGEQTGSSS